LEFELCPSNRVIRVFFSDPDLALIRIRG